MKSVQKFFCIAVTAVAGTFPLLAQGAGAPIDLQGMNQVNIIGVRARGMGGVSVAAANDANALFGNPALLTRLKSGEVRIAGQGTIAEDQQTQQWVPNRIYPGLSLLMADQWAGVKDPDLSTLSVDAAQWEKLQKPFDTMGPNWKRTKNRVVPISIAAAMPLQWDEFTIAAGVGFSVTTDLNHYFQNNNVLDPLLGSYRPQPIPVVLTGDTMRVRWFQYQTKREGQIYTVTPALALHYASLSVGVSALILSGTSDDFEQRLDRGKLTFIYNRFKIDSIQYMQIRSGTSTYSGAGATVGAAWESEKISIGGQLMLPMTVTRSSSYTTRTDTAGTVTSVASKGDTKLKMPLRWNIGFLLTPTKRWNIGFDYGITGFAKAEEQLPDGTTTTPWVGGGTYKIGAEFLAASWLPLRAGYRVEVQPFSPAGSAIIDESARASVMSAGVGVRMWDMMLEFAYEYTVLKYQDLWQSNINNNLSEQHRFSFELGYNF
jgi:hypothetical protein